MRRDEDDKTLVPLTPSGLRLGLILTIVFMVVSSPIIIFNPALAATASTSPLPSINTSPTAPSTIGQDGKEGDFTIQAALQIPRTLQSTDLVNSLAFYEVTFITSTTGPIDKIRMDFPAGTNIAAAGVIERVGIGGGTLLKSGSSITYDVTTPVSIPAGTFIRLEMFGIKNPINPSTTFTADITTRDSGGNLIDGPSQTNVYTMKQIGTNDIANGAITGSKIAGTQKLLFAKCTLPPGTGSLAIAGQPGDIRFVFCNVPGAQAGDVGLAQYVGTDDGAFRAFLIVVGMNVESADTVTLLLRNDSAEFPIGLDGENFSLLLFRK